VHQLKAPDWTQPPELRQPTETTGHSHRGTLPRASHTGPCHPISPKISTQPLWPRSADRRPVARPWTRDCRSAGQLAAPDAPENRPDPPPLLRKVRQTRMHMPLADHEHDQSRVLFAPLACAVPDGRISLDDADEHTKRLAAPGPCYKNRFGISTRSLHQSLRTKPNAGTHSNMRPTGDCISVMTA